MSTSPHVYTNHIGGEPVPAQSGSTLPVFNPATGVQVATIPDSGEEDVEAAVQAARAALDGDWGASATTERAALCERVADALEARAPELAELESIDTGKPIGLAQTVDIPRAIANFRFFAGAVRHQSGELHDMGDALNYTLRRPVGVVGLITPWNLPLYLLSWKVAPALATGNAIIAKPSEVTPMTASVLGDILNECGAPKGSFNLVHGKGSPVGETLCAHPGVQAISFTGGTQTGRRVGEAAGRTFKKLSLELGGKNATIICEDADLKEAVPGAVRAAFANQGQVCLCGSRILVHRTLYDSFLEAFLAEVAKLRAGDPLDPSTTFGSLVSKEHRKKVDGYVRLAEQEGGEILTGGHPLELTPPFHQGAFYAPTVIGGLAVESRSATEEIFGPVVTVHPFDSLEQAVGMANHGPYGLAASIWTRNLQSAHWASNALNVGMVWVNCWLKRDLRTPFGGVKHSGVGREGGVYSLAFYTEPKNVCIQN